MRGEPYAASSIAATDVPAYPCSAKSRSASLRIRSRVLSGRAIQSSACLFQAYTCQVSAGQESRCSAEGGRHPAHRWVDRWVVKLSTPTTEGTVVKKLSAVLASLARLVITANGYQPPSKRGYLSMYTFSFGVFAIELPLQLIAGQFAALAAVTAGFRRDRGGSVG